MKNPWICNDSAFTAMFSDVVEYSTQSERGTIKCCIFPVEAIDPFLDSDSASDIKSITILIKKPNYYFRQKPSIGDKIKTPETKFNVVKIDDEQSWYKIFGRTV